MEELTAKELHDDIAAGKVSSVETTKSVFERINKIEPVVGAFISTFNQMALERASDIDERIAAGKSVGALAGVPVAVKDNM